MFGIKRRNLQIKRIKRKNLRITQIHLLKICWHPEPYVGEEVTLTLDKERFFPDLDVWEQTNVEQGGQVVHYRVAVSLSLGMFIGLR